jgi:hypothetical protein
VSQQEHDQTFLRRAIVSHISMCHRMAEASIANRVDAVIIARRLDVHWTEIGAAMGMTRQTAHRRFSDDVHAAGVNGHPDGDEETPL